MPQFYSFEPPTLETLGVYHSFHAEYNYDSQLGHIAEVTHQGIISQKQAKNLRCQTFGLTQSKFISTHPFKPLYQQSAAVFVFSSQILF